MTETTRQPDGQWCWCDDPPEGQPPHDCAEDHATRPACQCDGAHVHPWSAVAEEATELALAGAGTMTSPVRHRQEHTTTELETEADALALPEVAAILAAGHAGFADGNRQMMSDALEFAGVTLGAYEASILLGWLSAFPPQMVAAYAAVIRRAHLEAREDGTDG